MGEPAVVGVVAQTDPGQPRLVPDQHTDQDQPQHHQDRLPAVIKSTGSPSTKGKLHPTCICLPRTNAVRKTTNPMAVPHLRTTQPTMMPVAEVYSAWPNSPNRPRWTTSSSISSAPSASSCRE